MAEIELNYSMDPIERLDIEIKACEDQMGQVIGKYLRDQLSSHSELKNAYFDRKITLTKVVEFVNECARKKLNSKNGCVEDAEVYGWVIHYVQDEEVKIPEGETMKVKNWELTPEEKEEARQKAIEQYQEQELAKIRKAEEKKAKAEEKKLETLKKKEEENGQLSLFDL